MSKIVHKSRLAQLFTNLKSQLQSLFVCFTQSTLSPQSDSKNETSRTSRTWREICLEGLQLPLNCLLLVALSLLSLHASAGDVVVWRDTFDSQSSIKNWYCESGFSVRMGEGESGSGALVWEESAIRPKPPPGTEPVVQEEDNIVRKLPQDGRKICSRRIPVEPGCRYTVSLRLRGAITNNCGYVFFDWYGRDGGRRGHCVAKPTIWKDVGTNGWQTISISSQRMPADAAAADVYLEFYRTTLGRMAFDDFTVTRDRKRFVEQMFSSAYRDEQTGGKVRFVAPYVLSKGMDVKDVSARFSFAGKEGSFAIPADKFNFGCFETTIDAERLAFGANEVKADFCIAERSWILAR